MAFKSLAALLCLALAGCAVDARMADEITTFNTAQAQGANQILLLNILRSRDRQPPSLFAFRRTARLGRHRACSVAQLPLGLGRGAQHGIDGPRVCRRRVRRREAAGRSGFLSRDSDLGDARDLGAVPGSELAARSSLPHLCRGYPGQPIRLRHRRARVLALLHRSRRRARRALALQRQARHRRRDREHLARDAICRSA